MGMKHGSIVFSHHLRSRLKVTYNFVSHLCMEPSVTALIAESHVTSMRVIASIARQHLEGSNQAARMLKRDKKISSAADRPLDCMATTYFVSEHNDVVMCNDFLRALERYVKGRSAFHLETTPKTQAPINVSAENTNLQQPREPARGRF